MKKIFYSILIAGFALVSASCQKTDEQSIKSDLISGKALTVTGSIVNYDGTRVTYDFKDETVADYAKTGIKASWQGGDIIFGFDNVGNNFKFKVDRVEDGKAIFVVDGEYTLTQDVSKLYAVYYPEKDISSVKDEEITVDLSSQNGELGTNTPAIMCATGTVNNGCVHFDFSNQTAIVGIYQMQIFNEGKSVDQGTTISSVTLNGVYAGGTIKIYGGNFGLVPNTKSLGVIQAAGLDLRTGDKGIIKVGTSLLKPYFAVIPSDDVEFTVTASDGTTEYSTNGTITGNLPAGTYTYIGKKIGVPVASIDDTKYFTISEAFNAAENNSVIKLLNDCEFDQSINLKDKGTIKITLNLNGKTLTDKSATARINLNNANATLTIIDEPDNNEPEGNIGTITAKSPDNHVISVTAGNLVVESGKILTNDGDESETTIAAIHVSDTGNASVTINGGEITGASKVTDPNDKRCYALYVENENAKVKITDGVFTSQSNNLRIIKANQVDIEGGSFKCETGTEYAIRLAGEYTCNIGGENLSVTSATTPVYIYSGTISLKITGGKYSVGSDKNHFSKSTSASGSTIDITGGKFSHRSASLASYLSNGYGIKKSSEEGFQYSVESGCDAEYTTGSNTFRYVTVTDAFDDVSGTCTVKLLNDHTMSKKCSLGSNDSPSGDLTLDLNGHTLFADQDGKRLEIQPENKKSSLTIKDSGTNGVYTQTEAAATENLLTIGWGGKVTLEGGAIKARKSVCIYGQRGQISIEGGQVENTGNSNGAIYCNSESCQVFVKDGIVNSTENCAICAKSGSVSITGGTVKSESSAANISTIKITGGAVTVEGEEALVSLPNLVGVQAATPIVQVESGTLTLTKGTIGEIKTGDLGNHTAIRLVKGTFTMSGGSVVARRHAILLSNTDNASAGGVVTITGGELYNDNTKSDYNLIRFAGTNAGTVTIGANSTKPYLFSVNSGRLFGVGGTSQVTTDYVQKITVQRGFFNEDISSVYNGRITINGTCSSLSEPEKGPSGKEYNYQVAP